MIAPHKGAQTSNCNLVTNSMLQQQIERFWHQEEMHERQQSKQDEACEAYFMSTFQRNNDGRFTVRLPKHENVVLGESEEQARKRLIALERRFQRNPELKQAYEAFLRDYEVQGHMSLISKELESSSNEIYYLPHQPVVRPDSVTMKLRIVFDASAKTTKGNLLNDRLMAGTNLQADLLGIILRFRTHEYVVTADIAMMFRQIRVDDSDCDMQRILWRTEPQQPIQKYRLNTVTYGTTCAPYLAMRCLKQLAMEEEARFPAAVHSLQKDCYMDDIITGAETLKEVIELQKQLANLLNSAQFHLRKWRSNHPKILEHLNEQSKTEDFFKLDGEKALKTLGLLWNASQDTLEYNVQTNDEYKITKRNVLSKIAQIFDPLGLIGPVLINAKIIMQQLWQLKLGWDERLPQSLYQAWTTYYSSLQRVSEIIMPRNINPGNASEKIDIFGFGDASERAYGACVYAVSTDHRGKTVSRLVCSKSRVAPLKTQSLPRLELNAALILAKLYAIVKEAYGKRLGKTYLWSDSTIVICWIRSEPSTLKTFVANRVSKIQTLTTDTIWLHVPSSDNPADMLSRGVNIDQLMVNPLWWHGPSWIGEEKDRWPPQDTSRKIELPELKTITAVAVQKDEEIIERFSSYNRLRKVVAYCLRFKSNTIGERVIGPVTAIEYDKAEKTLVKMVQRQEFLNDLVSLQEGRELSKRSKLVAFRPFLDEEGVIRVGGRLRHAEIATDQMHPAILPSKNALTRLIIRYKHERLHHCGTEQLLSQLRQRFWILSGRREIKGILKRCIQCFRCKSTSPEVIMGDLPISRVTGNARPFSCTGVDYAGPIKIKESRRRGRVHETKAYISIFVCMSTKAVHLELVTELSTEAFIAALRRFTGRRGICSRLYSDNGTNFVGANRELNEIYDFLAREEKPISSYIVVQIKWSFIPPRSPNFGGLWEAAVKVVKKHLYTVTKGLTQTFEDFYTLLVEIEAILNSRPLTPQSSDAFDLSVLTPSHFLIGESLIQPVQHDLCEVSDNRLLSHWQHVQKLRQHFWKRWHLEYLQELQCRHKWSTGTGNFKLNDLVLLVEENTPPLQWRMGRVVELHPGSDAVTRVASVRTETGLVKRSVRKLCFLPIEEQSREVSE